MADFDSILKATLKTVNEGFETAKKDFVKTVESISTSIKRNSSPVFALRFFGVEDTYAGSTYRVIFDSDEDDLEAKTVLIGDYFIPSKGYPIEYGSWKKSASEFEGISMLYTKDSLVEHFTEMLIDPDSKLIQAIGFGLRSKDD